MWIIIQRYFEKQCTRCLINSGIRQLAVCITRSKLLDSIVANYSKTVREYNCIYRNK